MPRVWVPTAIALLALAGSSGAAFAIHSAASAALDRELTEKLSAAANTGALLLAEGAFASTPTLKKLIDANALDGAYVVAADLRVVADGAGAPRERVDLLRVDARALERALQGEASVRQGYSVGELPVFVAYAPVRDGAQGRRVLVLEAGQTFARARKDLLHALWAAVGLALLGAGAVGTVAFRWTRAERLRSEAAARAARGEALTRVAAAAAHEIRNPLGVIRGTVELMRERMGPRLTDRDRESLDDVLGEVQRLRRLTEDLMDLAADRALAKAPVEVGELLAEAARAVERAFPQVEVKVEIAAPLTVEGDAGRLRQVLDNLLHNAAQAKPTGRIRIQAEAQAGGARIRVSDKGPGVSEELRARLFEPFATGREGGTGLGLAVSRRFVERHGGRLSLVEGNGPGATFELWLPLASTPEESA